MGSPARHSVNPSDSSLSFRSEKAAVEHSEKVVTSPTLGALRPGLWRRIWDRLSGSKNKTSGRSKGISPPPYQSKKCPSPTPVPTYQEWAKPANNPTVERAWVPPPRPFKYAIHRTYCPIKHVTKKGMISAPWIIKAVLASNTVAGVVCAPPRWPEHLHQCWYDKISAANHLICRTKRTYERRVHVAHLGADRSYDWSASVTIWNDDAQWLAALTYSDMRDMLLRRSLMKSVIPHSLLRPLRIPDLVYSNSWPGRTSGWRYDSDDPLVRPKLFYLNYSKPGCYKPWFPSLADDGVPSEDSLREVLDIQDPILWEQFDKHHSESEDWSL